MIIKDYKIPSNFIIEGKQLKQPMEGCLAIYEGTRTENKGTPGQCWIDIRDNSLYYVDTHSVTRRIPVTFIDSPVQKSTKPRVDKGEKAPLH